jgi:uncharacterized protein with HEPN domain
MEKDKTVYLRLIIDSINKIKSFVDGFDLESFSKDNKTQSAVIMQFQIIGELSKKVPDNIKDEIDIPWKQIAGFRDIISHDYFSIDTDLVWRTIEKDIPQLEKHILLYLEGK